MDTLDLYKSIADHAYDWIYWRAPDGRLRYVSPSCERLTGFQAGEFEVDPDLLIRVVHHDDKGLFLSHLKEEAGNGGNIVPFDFRIVTRDGKIKWVNHACVPVLDCEGRLLGRRATNRDVSARKVLEDEVRDLAKFPSENPNPVIRANGEGAVTYANEAGRALMQAWENTLRDELPPPLRDAIAESFTAGVRRRADIGYGERIYAFDVIRPAGAPYVNLYGADVTERRKAEDGLRVARDALDLEVRERTAELRRTNRLLRMISACNQALVGIDDEKELIQAICQLILDEGGFRMVWVGYAEQDDGKLVRPAGSAGFEDGYLERAAITWADTERGRGPTGRAIRECRPYIGNDFLTQPELAPWREDAISRGFRSSIALPLVSQGRAFGALTIYSDQPAAFGPELRSLLSELAGDLAFGILTVRARAQRDQALASLEQKTGLLRSLAVELVQAEERERRRIGRVLHDQLQQLLAGARFGLESLRSTGGTEDIRQTIDKIDGMLKEGLDVSRSLTTELSPPIQYSAELESILGWLGAWARERFGLQVAVEAEGDIRVESEEVRMMLFRAVRELLFNIVKHADVKEAIVSTSLHEKNQVQVVVRDKGKGFDPAAIRAGGGTRGGFGLFSLRERLEALGGSMHIESSPGVGSAFTVRLPAQPLSPGAQAYRPSVRSVRSTAAKPVKGQRPEAAPFERPMIRVLLVDDHLVVRQGLAMVLGGESDIEIVGEASDGRSAVELARRLLPDVVTMDVGLPGMSGIEATRTIHAELPEIAIIGLSMFDDQGEAMRKAGAVGYLPKTGASSNLLAAIRSACRKTPT
ncbi:MAG: response regulator [Spirochaetia bacterium]|jgi:PAS domain S-box-containing protein